MESQSETTQTVSALKHPVLKTGEYDLWSMRMEQYLTFTDHALWEVIVNGDSVSLVASASAEGLIPPKTAKQKNGFKWQVAMLTMRVKMFIKKIGRKLDLNDKETVGFDRSKVECYNCHRRGHFVRECRAPRNQGNRNRDAPRRNALAEEGLTNFALMGYTSQGLSSSSSSDSEREALNKSNLEIIGYQMGLESLEARIVVHEKNEAVYEEDIALLKYDVQVKDISIKELKNQLENALKEKDDLKLKLEKFETSSKNLTNLINSQISAKYKTGLGSDGQMNESDLNDIHVNESEVLDNVFDIPPPYTGNYMPPRADLSFAGLDDYVFKSTCGKPKTVSSSAPLIEEWESDSEDENMFKPKEVKITVKPSFEKIEFDNARNTTVEKPRKFSLSQSLRVNKRNWNVLTKSGQVPINAAKQSSHRAAVSVSAARRFFNQKSAAKTNNFKEKVNTGRFNNVTTAGPKVVVSAVEGNRDNAIKSSTCWIWRPKGNLIDLISKDSGSYTLKRFDYGNPQYALQDQGIFDSGCSRHMTGNKSHVTDYQEIDGGFVAFGGNAKRGKITGKGKLRTGKLDFEDVYFVKELKFNLFSVSQMCDKKNSVLFTNTKYVVLSPDFKLLDESQVLLKVPRNNNMYSFDLKNVVPLGDSKLPTTFWAKAVNTACYVQNRMLVIKPYNKTPYELFLGKFDGKSDDGFFVGYSINSKAFRVFNTRTRFVEENLHINFLENKQNVAGTGPNWIFDIDTLTMSMNYQQVSAGNQTNGNAGPKRLEDEVADDAGQKNGFLDPEKAGDKNGQEKDVRDQEEALRKQFEQEFERLSGQWEATNTNITNRLTTVSSSINDVSSSFTTVDPGRERAQRNEFESMFGQDKDTNGNNIYRMFTPDSVTGSSYDSLGGSIPINAATLPNVDLPIDPLMPDLEDTADLQVTRIFNGAYNDEVESAVANFNNLDLTTVVSPIPTTRIHKDHHKEQIIWDPLSAPQTRRMTKTSQEHATFSLQKVWRLVDLPKGKHAIGTKWVYRNKKDKRGIVVRNKARLVVQGHTQEEGIDYDEVFAHVARIEAIRLFLAYAPFMGFIVYQMDVKSAFLYGKIEEEVYVCQPPSFEDPQFPNKVYKVEKALYGLHQAHRARYKTLSTYLLENGFRRGIIDKTLFIKKGKGDILLVQVYVDDIIFRSTKKSLCKEFEGLMHKKFQMSSIGELTFFLVKTASTPIETNKALLKDEEAEDVDVYLYRSMIRSLMYLTASRPDIMFAIYACARDSPFDLEAFLDSDYAGASFDRKSTIGGCQFLGKRLISWQCKKQTIVSNSTTETEDSYEKRLIQVIKIHTDHNVDDLLIKAFDVSSDEFRVKTDSCKVNAARQDLVLLGES
ncbi:putative ribonuclease H-like domain-containing protein [Tanacetum coccineum]|uniref:Ribonuclease H-like domain-containing protein n=1 Tax=Tanacetum coccineum TaxID=301880 RepID=A0ABQ5IG38_9ASTR